MPHRKGWCSLRTCLRWRRDLYKCQAGLKYTTHLLCTRAIDHHLWVPRCREVNIAEVVMSSLSISYKNSDLEGHPRRILTEQHGYRIAVIMNEFGDTAVS